MVRFVALFLVFVVFAPALRAQSALGIAAIVNDDVISIYDLVTRTNLTIATSGIRPNAEQRERLSRQVLNQLIDEKLQLQEAERMNLLASQETVDQALAGIAQQNKLSVADFLDLLRSRGVDPKAMEQHVYARASWIQVVRRRLSANVRVTDDEVLETIERINSAAGQPEHRFLEIFLPVSSPKDEAQIRRTAEDIVARLNEGADFASFARNFSHLSSAQRGGDAGWVQLGIRDLEVDAALLKLAVGEVSRPVRTIGGYYLLRLLERRQAEGLAAVTPQQVSLQTLSLELPPGTTTEQRQQARQSLATLTSSLSSCDVMGNAARSQEGVKLSENRRDVLVKDLRRPIANAIKGLSLNRPSQILRTDTGLMVVMVCERSGGEIDEEIRKRVYDALLEQRLEKSAQRLVNSLRRSAHVDLRI